MHTTIHNNLSMNIKHIHPFISLNPPDIPQMKIIWMFDINYPIFGWELGGIVWDWVGKR